MPSHDMQAAVPRRACGSVDTTNFIGSIIRDGTASMLMRGRFPDTPRAEGMDDWTDTLVILLDS